LQLPSIARLAKNLRDVEHELGFAVLWHGGAYAHAVARTDDGSVLAWDGWYPQDAPPGMRLIDELDFDDFDDMPSKLLMSANRPWLAGELAYWLMPTYSVAVAAADLVKAHFDTELEAQNRRSLSEADLVAYLPVVHREVFDREIGLDIRARIETLTEGE